MKFKIVESKKELTMEALQNAEKIIGVKLPEDYRTFLLTHNGGRPEPDMGFKFKHPIRQFDESMIHFFYSINDGKGSNLIKEYKKHTPYMPDDMLIIANDPGSGLIVLGIRGERREKVYFWMQEFDEGLHYDAECTNFAIVADSFNEFLEKLYPVE